MRKRPDSLQPKLVERFRCRKYSANARGLQSCPRAVHQTGVALLVLGLVGQMPRGREKQQSLVPASSRSRRFLGQRQQQYSRENEMEVEQNLEAEKYEVGCEMHPFLQRLFRPKYLV